MRGPILVAVGNFVGQSDKLATTYDKKAVRADVMEQGGVANGSLAGLVLIGAKLPTGH